MAINNTLLPITRVRQRFHLDQPPRSYTHLPFKPLHLPGLSPTRPSRPRRAPPWSASPLLRSTQWGTSLLYTSLQGISNSIVTLVTLESHTKEEQRRNDVKIRGANRIGPVDYEPQGLLPIPTRCTTHLHQSARVRGVILWLRTTPVPQFSPTEDSRCHKGCRLLSGGAFKPLVIQRGSLVKEKTEDEMRNWTKELGKFGGG